MPDGDGDRMAVEKQEIMLAPPEKKQKLNETVQETTFQPKINDDDDCEEEDEDLEDEDDDDDYSSRFKTRTSKERRAEMIREDKELDEKLRIYWTPYDPIDVTDAILIFVNPQDLGRQGFNLNCFKSFYNQSHNRRTLQVYDHPGDPRPGGLMHWGIEFVTEEDDNLASFAIARYNDLIEKSDGAVKAGKLELKRVDKVSCTPDWDSFNYITFKTLDKLEDKVKTYQAQLLESTDDELLLGMLRDVDENKVLAVLQLKEGPEEDTPAGYCISDGST